VQLCLEEMEPDLREAVGEVPAEVLAEAEVAKVEWEVPAPAPVRVGNVSAPIVVPKHLIRSVPLATI